MSKAGEQLEREVISPGGCFYNGHKYKAGDGFNSSDGCNRCGCSDNGLVMCTLMACVNLESVRQQLSREAITPGVCLYNGHVYKAGEGFKSTDGCNRCGCSDNGLVICTQMACVNLASMRQQLEREVISPGVCHHGGHVYKAGEGYKAPDGCNTCSCSDSGFIRCTLMACANLASERHQLEREVISLGVCVYGGKVYQPRDSFDSLDKCNRCACGKHGQIMCTLRSCPIGMPDRGNHEGDDEDARGCDYDGHWYADGESTLSTDGCNTCTCAAPYGMACTKRACLPPANDETDDEDQNGCHYNGHWFADGESTPSTDGCNTCTCMASLGMACTEMACAVGK
ncbi:kielin/chordin-like protein [Liolophura sinensis]|uniref:kielin/chordin-like protein n=1 Tax=Liolophura sinensis TaxID=3198878 RepID=UPI003158178B